MSTLEFKITFNPSGNSAQVMLSTFRTDLPPSCHVRVSFIVDCHSPADFGASSETYEVRLFVVKGFRGISRNGFFFFYISCSFFPTTAHDAAGAAGAAAIINNSCCWCCCCACFCSPTYICFLSIFLRSQWQVKPVSQPVTCHTVCE